MLLPQSSYRKVQNVGLQDEYNDPQDRTVKITVHMMLALAFVPLEFVQGAFDDLERTARAVAPVLQYFDETYRGSGEHHHSKAAPVSATTKGTKRKDLKQMIKDTGKAPAVVHRDLLCQKAKQNKASLDAGNFDDVPSLSRIQKMSSENNTEQDMDKDFRSNLELTCESLEKDYGSGSFFIVSHVAFQVAWCTDNMAYAMMS